MAGEPVARDGGGGPALADSSGTTVILFYCYSDTAAAAEVKRQEELCERLGLYGRVLVSEEGLNGTLAGGHAVVTSYIEDLCSRIPSLGTQDFKFSSHQGSPDTLFPDLQVRQVKELISTGGKFSSIPTSETGQGYLSPEEFHQALVGRGEDTVVIDCRNHKEVMIGHFEGAVDPNTRTWAEWPSYVEGALEQLKGKQVLMYCTGGIRCEKASAFVRQKLREAGDPAAADGVRHLRGGIHKYLEAYPDGGMFMGKNFVFDNRMAMSAAESETVVGKCFSCGALHDTVQFNVVCTVCRDPALACVACQKALREFHCEAHMHLAACYFTNLQGFSRAELEQQCADLKSLRTVFGTAQSELQKISDGKAFRNKRRTLRSQVQRITELLALGDGEQQGEDSMAATAAGPACRSCGSPTCSGACWGFHGRGRLKSCKQAGEADQRREAEAEQSSGVADGTEADRDASAVHSSSSGPVVLCYNASSLVAACSPEEAENIVREAAAKVGAELDAVNRRMHGPPGLSHLCPELQRLRSKGVTVWAAPQGPPSSKREAKRMAKAERRRDPNAKARRKDSQRAAAGRPGGAGQVTGDTQQSELFCTSRPPQGH